MKTTKDHKWIEESYLDFSRRWRCARCGAVRQGDLHAMGIEWSYFSPSGERLSEKPACAECDPIGHEAKRIYEAIQMTEIAS